MTTDLLTRDKVLHLIDSLKKKVSSIKKIETDAGLPSDCLRDFIRGKKSMLRADDYEKLQRFAEHTLGFPMEIGINPAEKLQNVNCMMCIGIIEALPIVLQENPYTLSFMLSTQREGLVKKDIHEIILTGEKARNTLPSLKKGSYIALKGELHSYWKDKDGKIHQRSVIESDTILGGIVQKI